MLQTPKPSFPTNMQSHAGKLLTCMCSRVSFESDWPARWALATKVATYPLTLLHGTFTGPSRDLGKFSKEDRRPNETKVLCSWKGYKLTPLLTQHRYCFQRSLRETFTDLHRCKEIKTQLTPSRLPSWNLHGASRTHASEKQLGVSGDK